jgi:predicted enzyme involved in methoxymalonyl-ACP biosynthesis
MKKKYLALKKGGFIGHNKNENPLYFTMKKTFDLSKEGFVLAIITKNENPTQIAVFKHSHFLFIKLN